MDAQTPYQSCFEIKYNCIILMLEKLQALNVNDANDLKASCINASVARRIPFEEKKNPVLCLQ